MNRRNFLGLLAGGLAAGAAVVLRPLGNWRGTKIDPYPGRLCTPTPRWTLYGGARGGGKMYKAHPHPFWNDGASSGVCKLCAGPITTHRAVLLRTGTIMEFREVMPDRCLPVGGAWPKYRQG